MKILINIEPASIHELFLPSTYVYKEMRNKLKSLEAKCELKFLISERAYYQLKEENYKFKNEIICIPDIEYRKAFNNEFISHEEMQKAFAYQDLAQDTIQNLNTMYKKYLGKWTPDIIITYELFNKSLSKIYTNTMQLTYTGGIFKREILPLSLQFDAVGCVGNSFLCKYADEINKTILSYDEKECILNLKKQMQEIITDPITVETIKNLKNKFKYILLLPLQISNHFGFDCECEFKTQWDLVTYVLDNVPKEVGVIVTEHSHSKFLREGRFVKDGFYNWIKNKYNNFIYLNPRKNWQASSLYILPEVDGVINVSSTVGMLALLFDKKIISLAKKYNDPYKDTQGFNDLINTLENKEKRNTDNFIYWLLTRFTVYQQMIDDKDWLYNFLNYSLKKYKTDGTDFNFYKMNMNIQEVSNYILNTIENNYRVIEPQKNEINENSTEINTKKISLLQKIFSVKNSTTHKIIRFCGLKFKIKRGR